MSDPAGTLGGTGSSSPKRVTDFPKALERNIFNVKHDRPLSRLRRDWTSFLVKSSMIHPNPAKPAFQGVGSVLGGSVQCNDEVKTRYKITSMSFFFR
jgi:hypothetical protein